MSAEEEYSKEELESAIDGSGYVIAALVKKFAPDGVYLSMEELEDSPELNITEDFVRDRIHIMLLPTK